jgi:hypothetical protein
MNTTFGIGNVLATGFRIWVRNFVPFIVITVLLYAPAILWSIAILQRDTSVWGVEDTLSALRYCSWLMMLLNLLISAALTYGVVMELQGQRASIGACIATGLSRFVPSLIVGVLATLCWFAGLCAFILPGLILFPMLYVATQASVLERPGLLGALGRSRALTRGHRVRILVIAALMLLLNMVLQRAVAMTFFDSIADLNRFVYAFLVEQMLTASLSAVMTSVTYYLLRAEKEGTSASELAAVFD